MDRTKVETITMTPQQQAIKALSIAAERIGRNGYEAAVRTATKRQVKDAKSGKRSLYHPTAEHQAVIEAQQLVATGQMSPDEAMNLLRQYNVATQRGV